jgi:hypothetical protein
MRDWLQELFEETLRQKFPNRVIKESDLEASHKFSAWLWRNFKI